jgi:hypothetical protein
MVGDPMGPRSALGRDEWRVWNAQLQKGFLFWVLDYKVLWKAQALLYVSVLKKRESVRRKRWAPIITHLCLPSWLRPFVQPATGSD